MPKPRLAAGVDLGGTKIYSLVADQDGNVLGEDRRPTNAALGVDSVVERIVASVRAALNNASLELTDVLGLGISTPGPCDPAHGLITEAPNLGWVNVPLVELVKKKVITWPQMVEKMSKRPAEIVGLANKGEIKEGRDADITIIDPDKEWEFKKENIVSKSKNSPFIGRRLTGCTEATICGGKLVYQAGR